MSLTKCRILPTLFLLNLVNFKALVSVFKKGFGLKSGPANAGPAGLLAPALNHELYRL